MKKLVIPALVVLGLCAMTVQSGDVVVKGQRGFRADEDGKRKNVVKRLKKSPKKKITVEKPIVEKKKILK